MHKSVYASLFLMALLILLVPFASTNTNNFSNSNVVPQAYGDNYRSSYPTDDYKHECRTGPFEGFFVSSVEFCLTHSFDDDKKKKDRPIIKPPVPPTPPTGSLTVNKEIFGCNIIINTEMRCQPLLNDSPLWLPCINSEISNTAFCQNLPPNLFDIEVLGEIQQFEGSTAGTTVQNLQPDSFRVNEIVHEDRINQLGDDPATNSACKGRGFVGGGVLQNDNTQTVYEICFEYKDEQGNDCNPITIAAGEEKTCTVKNYIRAAVQNPV